MDEEEVLNIDVYSSLEHTRKLSNRRFVKLVRPEDYPETLTEKGLVVYSEGAWRITFNFTKAAANTAQCFLTFSGGDPIELASVLAAGNNAFAGINSMVLDGDISTVRDDEIKVQFNEEAADCTLQIFFERVVWKKDDNFYPAQARDKRELQKLNAEGTK